MEVAFCDFRCKYTTNIRSIKKTARFMMRFGICFLILRHHSNTNKYEKGNEDYSGHNVNDSGDIMHLRL